MDVSGFFCGHVHNHEVEGCPERCGEGAQNTSPHRQLHHRYAGRYDGLDRTFQLARSNRKLYDFIQRYPQVIEDVRMVLGQPKAASIHASAIIVTPDSKDGQTAECFDFLPVRKWRGRWFPSLTAIPWMRSAC